MMTNENFLALLDAHGADLQRWPKAERSAAEQLLADSAEAQQALRRAAELDRQLAALAPPAHAALAARIMAAADEQNTDPVSRFARWLSEQYWRPTALVMAPLLLGIALGVASTQDDELDQVLIAEYPWAAVEEFYDDVP